MEPWRVPSRTPSGRMDPRFTQALYYVGVDYEPGLPQSPGGAVAAMQRVRTAGLGAFRNIVGCILCNELIDNFPGAPVRH